MIVLHQGKDAKAHMLQVADHAPGAVYRYPASRRLNDCPKRVAEWLVRTADPALILIDAAGARSHLEHDSLMSVRRMAKYRGVDVHLIGNDMLHDVADYIVVGDKVFPRRQPSSTVPDEMGMTPFERVEMDVPTWQELAAITAFDDAQAKARIRQLKAQEVWANNLYQVNVEYLEKGRIAHLIIRRMDRKPLHNWPHFQRIKNELIGPECEAVELYPSERHLVDAKHHYHLWAYTSPEDSFGVGFKNGRELTDAAAAGAVEIPD